MIKSTIVYGYIRFHMFIKVRRGMTKDKEETFIELEL